MKPLDEERFPELELLPKLTICAGHTCTLPHTHCLNVSCWEQSTAGLTEIKSKRLLILSVSVK